MNLEDKILGEKLNYYCSSSEDEKEDSGDEGAEEGKNNGKAQAAESKLELAPDTAHFSNSGSSNTGPKGLLSHKLQFNHLTLNLLQVLSRIGSGLSNLKLKKSRIKNVNDWN